MAATHEINGVECTETEIRAFADLQNHPGFKTLAKVFMSERDTAFDGAAPRNLPEPDKRAKVIMPWEQFRAACERNTGRYYAFDDMLKLIPQAREEFADVLKTT